MIRGILAKHWFIWALVFALVFTLVPEKYLGNKKVQAEETVPVMPMKENADASEKRNEVVSMRAEKSKTYQNANGSFTTEISEKPIHYKESENKQWLPIDNTLIPSAAEDKMVNKANSLKASFNKQSADEGPLVEVQEGAASISLNPAGDGADLPSSVQTNKKEVNAKTTGNEIIYPEIYPNVDLKYVIGSDSVKEDIILKQRPDEFTDTTYSFAMDLQGLSFEEQANGRILFTELSTKEPAFYLEKPFMYDSSRPEGYQEQPGVTSFPEEALSYDVEMEVEQRGNQLFIDVIPSKAWLDNENRVYPVVIDPTIVKYDPKASLEDTNIRSHFPNNTGGAESTLGVGLYQDATQTNKIRSLLKFDLSAISPGVEVVNATLNMYLSSVWNDTPIQVDLHEVTNTWTEGGATWAKRDGINPWTKSGGDYLSTPLSSVTDIDYIHDISFNSRFDIPPTIATKWIREPHKNKGIMLKANNETIKTWKKFISSDETNIYYKDYTPLLAVTYFSASRLGLEDYWTYNEHEIAGGQGYINVGTGNGVFQFNDFAISSRGNSGISFERTYNTKSEETDSFGPGWSFTGSETLTEIDGANFDTTKVIYTDRDGTSHEFVFNATTGKYLTPTGSYLTLVEDGTAAYLLTDKFGNVSRFTLMYPDWETSGYSIHKLEYEVDRNGNKTSYTYDGKNRITGITDASGRKMTIVQGTVGISSVTFAGKKITYHYTSKGQLGEVRKYLDSTKFLSTFFKYNSSGHLEHIVDANGNTMKITYQNEFVQSIQEPSTTTAALAVTTYSNDIFNYTAEVTDPAGGITKYQLNEQYVVNKMTDQLGKIVSIDAFDTNFNPTQVTDAEGHITKQLFDAKGNLLEATDAKGVKSTNTFDTFSNLKTATNTKGTTSLNYDAKGNLDKLTEADGNITSQAYDIYGNPKSTTASDGTQQLYAFDTAGNYETGGTDQIGRITTMKPDAFGNVTSRTDPKSNITSYTYDQRDLMKDVADAKGGMTPYEYDGNGNLLSVINAEGKKTAFTYNGRNLLKTKTQPMGEITSLAYDNNGNLVGLNQPTGTIIKNEYDKANQLLWIYADSVKKWGFTYDGNGNVKTVTDAATAQVKSYAYDKNNNLDFESKGTTSIDYGYNAANELNSIIGKSNATTFTQTFDFNEVGRIKTTKRNGANLVTFDYKPVGLPSYVLYSNGIQTDFGFDKAQQLETLSVKKGTTALLTESFKYDANGNIETITSSGGNRAYTYDELNQLKSQTLPNGTIESYEYDRVGNRLQKKSTVNGQTATTVYGHNDNNQLTSVNGVSFAYDANGNRTKDTRFSYHYNKFDELESVKTLSGQLVASYEYDEQGRRISKTINGVKTNYHYGQGIEVLFETNAAGDIITEYTYDQRGFPKTLTKNGQTYFYVLNGHFDVVALTDASGQTVASYSYDAWGNILSQSGAMATENPYRYAGYRYDEETEHYYLIARYYNADEGVFLSSDPIAGEAENPQSQNGYSYTENNPVMLYDPNGQNPLLIPLAVAVARQLGKKYGTKAAAAGFRALKPWLKKVRDDSKNYSLKVDPPNAKGAFSIKIFKKGIGSPVFRLEMHYEKGRWDLHYHINGTKVML